MSLRRKFNNSIRLKANLWTISISLVLPIYSRGEETVDHRPDLEQIERIERG